MLAAIHLRAVVGISTFTNERLIAIARWQLGQSVIQDHVHRRGQVQAAYGGNEDHGICSVYNLLVNGVVLRAKNVERIFGVLVCGQRDGALYEFYTDYLCIVGNVAGQAWHPS